MFNWCRLTKYCLVSQSQDGPHSFDMVSLEIILMTAFFIAMLIVDPDLYIFLKAMYVKR